LRIPEKFWDNDKQWPNNEIVMETIENEKLRGS